MPDRIFISATTAEYGKLREKLAFALQRAGFEVEYQEIFPQTNAKTLSKLSKLLHPCRLVIHIVGNEAGSVAKGKALEDFRQLIAEGTLLPEHSEVLLAMGDFSGITYTQWEAFLALHHGVPLLVYAPISGWDAKNKAIRDDFSQKEHLDRLKLAGKNPDWCAKADFALKILPDVSRELGIPLEDELEQELSAPKFLHHAAEHFLGREEELAMLDAAWDGEEVVNVLSIIAWGGVGKTSLLAAWIQRRFIDREWRDVAGDPDPWRYFDWSFYEQGTSPDEDDEESGQTAVRTGSVGDFFECALTFFGDETPNEPGKGARLAKLIRRQRSLLILDGVEPLQQPPNHPQAGRLLDDDLRALLDALALKNPGLCIVTSRQALTDLSGLKDGAAKEWRLSELSMNAAVRLLQLLQIVGTEEELNAACEDFGCHALSLTLLGRYLFDAHGGDIQRRDQIDLHEADDATRPDRKRTVWKVMAAYDAWLGSSEGRPEELAALRLTGLFDRPARAHCLKALRDGEVIIGLTEHLKGMKDDRWNILLKRLERAGLVSLKPEEGNSLGIDSHPLVREYFAGRLRKQQPEAFAEAHSRLFDHLCEHTEHRPDTLEGLLPLYEAVTHACLARRFGSAFKVHQERIYRREKRFMNPRQNSKEISSFAFYSINQLGAMSLDLSAIGNYFESGWQNPAPTLGPNNRSFLFSQAGFLLRAVGRLQDALGPMLDSIRLREEMGQIEAAAGSGNNACEIYSLLGELDEAIEIGQKAAALSNVGTDDFQRVSTRATLAYQFLLRGNSAQAKSLFEDAEKIQAKTKPAFPILGSLAGFRYSEYLLRAFDRAIWMRIMGEGSSASVAGGRLILEDVERRAKLKLVTLRRGGIPLISLALDKLVLARVEAFRIGEEGQNHSAFDRGIASANSALSALRVASQNHFIPAGLLHVAFVSGIIGATKDSMRPLDEAQQIAERGPMPLYLADVHLHRARLFRDKSELTAAAELIHKHRYGRRYEELSDAETASENW